MADKVTAGDWCCNTNDQGLASGRAPYVCLENGSQTIAYVLCYDDIRNRDLPYRENAALIVAAVNPLFEINPEHPEKVATEIGEAIELLREAERQIEYLHRKFKPTGTGENVLAKLRALLSRIDTDKGDNTDGS